MIGKTISHYKILEKLGEGGMGVVYKAEDAKLKRCVALKFLPPELTRDQEARKRFLHEAQTASSLEDSHICTIYEIGEYDNQVFIVMPCYEGKSLNDTIGKGPLPLDRVLDIAIQAGEGLQVAHDKGIVHRDIKSANLFLTDKGQVRILDFGLAKLTGRTKLTKTGTTLGTVSYMSPEQTEGKKVDHRSDIWSLGILLYEMITGELPFKGDYEQAVVYSIMNELPEPVTGLRSGIPMELERIVNKTLAKNPGERYQSINDLLVDCRTLERNLDVETKKSKIRKPKSKKRIAVFLFALTLAALLTTAGILWFTLRSGKVDSIAVLPFENRTEDPQLEYLCDGLAESIIESIEKVSGFKKISPRTSSFYFKQKQIDPKEVGNKLGVKALLLGFVSQFEKELSVSVELIRVANNSRLWGKRFQRTQMEIDQLQKEISTGIITNLGIQVTEEDDVRLNKMFSRNPQANQAYLQGKFHFEKLTREGIKRSITHFKNAVRLDPNFARAYTGLAKAYDESGIYTEFSRESVSDSAMSAVLKALEIDNTLSHAFSMLASLKTWRLPIPFLESERDLKKALALDLNNYEAYHLYSHFLSRMGRVDEGLELMEKALELDPLSENINGCMVESLLLAGELDRAMIQSRKLEEMYPGSWGNKWWLGWVYVARGEFEEAIDLFKTFDADPVFRLNRFANLGYVYAVTGQKQMAFEQLALLHEQSTSIKVDPTNFAAIYAGLGEVENAFEWLNKAVDENASSLMMYKTALMFRDLRGDARFQQLIHRIGMDVELEGFQ